MAHKKKQIFLNLHCNAFKQAGKLGEVVCNSCDTHTHVRNEKVNSKDSPQSITPTDQRSTLESYWRRHTISGAMQRGEPLSALCSSQGDMYWAKPKSESQTECKQPVHCDRSKWIPTPYNSFKLKYMIIMKSAQTKNKKKMEKKFLVCGT